MKGLYPTPPMLLGATLVHVMEAVGAQRGGGGFGIPVSYECKHGATEAEETDFDRVSYRRSTLNKQPHGGRKVTGEPSPPPPALQRRVPFGLESCLGLQKEHLPWTPSPPVPPLARFRHACTLGGSLCSHAGPLPRAGGHTETREDDMSIPSSSVR
ncbi:hypothetical protein EYF80_004744 [Liparis tanakae]|uniref:Uncharacterized protein n=1 Tax=Liparis tanakae TaxID=230148 RepID=A0A4Z2J4I0_9TELE|nr:hypothetical protein EYF80_004744 [Liparis tanakae]